MDEKWARWWLWLWGGVAVGLLAAVFLIPFKWWVVAAAVGFGVMEGTGLAREHDRYPPLTHVLHKYVWRWATFTAIYAFTGAAGSVWFKIRKPYELAAIFGLLGWLTSHFDTTYDNDLSEREHEKYRAVARMLPGGKKSD